MPSKENDIKKHWDHIYRTHRPEELPWEAGEPDEDLVELVEKKKIKKGKVLDICTGLGTHSIYMAKQGFNVSGIDISPTAIKKARERAKAAGAKCDFNPGNAIDLKYPSENFTFVLDRGCFHHVPVEDRETFIRGVHRVLKPGGLYHLSCFCYKNGPGWNHFTREQIRDYFGPYFEIEYIKEAVHVEPPTSQRVHLYRALMTKKPRAGVM